MTITAGPELETAARTEPRQGLRLVVGVIVILALILGAVLVASNMLSGNDPDAEALKAVDRSQAMAVEGRYEEALASATAAIDLRPDNPDLPARAYLNRAVALGELGRYEEAAADLSAITQILPEAHELHQRQPTDSPSLDTASSRSQL